MSGAHGDRAVIRSVEDAHGERCVDFLALADGTFVFKVYRKEPEDQGRWSLVADHSAVTYATAESAYQAAQALLLWLP